MNCSKHPTTLHLESPGLGVSIQDRGRVGHRSIGVPVSGALDPRFLAAANALAGNPPDAAGLEVLLAGPLLRATGGPVRVALAGEMDARHIDAAGERRPVAAWSTASSIAAAKTLRASLRPSPMPPWDSATTRQK